MCRRGGRGSPLTVRLGSNAINTEICGLFELPDWLAWYCRQLDVSRLSHISSSV